MHVNSLQIPSLKSITMEIAVFSACANTILCRFCAFMQHMKQFIHAGAIVNTSLSAAKYNRTLPKHLNIFKMWHCHEQLLLTAVGKSCITAHHCTPCTFRLFWSFCFVRLNFFYFCLLSCTNITFMLSGQSCLFSPFGTNSFGGARTDFPASYGLYCVAHYRPCAFCTSVIPVNHIRPHATFSCYLVLMVTAVMREEMREWWMVIVVLLLLNIWPGTILAVFSHGTLNASLS